MTTIASQADPERTNRWLLIGGLALALMTGVIVFAAVANFGGDDDGTAAPAGGGSAQVLVAKDTITAGTTLETDMFRVATFAEADLVPQPLSDAEAIVGQQSTVDILKGQQLSREQVTQATDDKRADQLAFKLPEGHRGFSVAVNEVSAVGGLLVPGDHVDIVVSIKEQRRPGEREDQKFMRIQTVLQNVLVVAREQLDVNTVTAIGEDGKLEEVANGQDFAQRPEDVDPDPQLSTVTLALTPEQVQVVVLADQLGELTLSLRRFGEDGIPAVQDIIVPIFE